MKYVKVTVSFEARVPSSINVKDCEVHIDSMALTLAGKKEALPGVIWTQEKVQSVEELPRGVMYFCIDVSGSMSDRDLQFARAQVADFKKPGDFVVLFDCEVRAIIPIDDYMAEKETRKLVLKGGGGTDCRECIQSVHEHSQHNAISPMRTTLISDCELPADQLKIFDEVIQTPRYA